MKKMLLVAAMAVASLTANAQVWIGGGLGFNYEEPKVGDASTTFNIAPQVGYNLDENLSLGIELGLKLANKAAGDYTDMTVAPFARYTYFKSGIASFFVDGGFGIGSHKPSGEDAETVWHVGLRPGVAINLSDNVSIISQLGYLGYQHRDGLNRFALNANENALTFGVYYTF